MILYFIYLTGMSIQPIRNCLCIQSATFTIFLFKYVDFLAIKRVQSQIRYTFEYLQILIYGSKAPHTLNLSQSNFHILTRSIFDNVELHDNAFSSVYVLLINDIHIIMLLLLTVMNFNAKNCVINALHLFAKYH